MTYLVAIRIIIINNRWNFLCCEDYYGTHLLRERERVSVFGSGSRSIIFIETSLLIVYFAYVVLNILLKREGPAERYNGV